ncbi:hypothetical protein AB4383_17940 [Vibrio breoganii]
MKTITLFFYPDFKSAMKVAREINVEFGERTSVKRDDYGNFGDCSTFKVTIESQQKPSGYEVSVWRTSDKIGAHGNIEFNRVVDTFEEAERLRLENDTSIIHLSETKEWTDYSVYNRWKWK